MTTQNNLNAVLLCSLGLSAESARMVSAEIERLEKERDELRHDTEIWRDTIARLQQDQLRNAELNNNTRSQNERLRECIVWLRDNTNACYPTAQAKRIEQALAATEQLKEKQ